MTVNLANFAPGAAAQVWQLTASNTITRLADVDGVRPGLRHECAGAERHAVRRPAVWRAGEPAAGCPCDRDAGSGTAPLAVAFDGSASSDPDGSIASYAWTFGDGGSATGPTTSHTYQSAGTYTARLTVTDNQGATGTTTLAITVSLRSDAPGRALESERVGRLGPRRHAQLD